MEFTERQIDVITGVFGELLKMKYDDLNSFLGSETISEMQDMYSRLYYREYCERHGIRYEDMTEADFEQEYAERWEA